MNQRNSYQFAWTCSYLNCLWYEFTTPTEHYKVELRHGTSDYERSITNGGAEYYDRHMAPLVNSIHRESKPTQAIPLEDLEAFNAWRIEKHNEQRAKILAAPERYGSPQDNPDDPFWIRLFADKEPVRAARLVNEEWIFSDDPRYLDPTILDDWDAGKKRLARLPAGGYDVERLVDGAWVMCGS